MFPLISRLSSHTVEKRIIKKRWWLYYTQRENTAVPKPFYLQFSEYRFMPQCLCAFSLFFPHHFKILATIYLDEREVKKYCEILTLHSLYLMFTTAVSSVGFTVTHFHLCTPRLKAVCKIFPFSDPLSVFLWLHASVMALVLNPYMVIKAHFMMKMIVSALLPTKTQHFFQFRAFSLFSEPHQPPESALITLHIWQETGSGSLIQKEQDRNRDEMVVLKISKIHILGLEKLLFKIPDNIHFRLNDDLFSVCPDWLWSGKILKKNNCSPSFATIEYYQSLTLKQCS